MKELALAAEGAPSTPTSAATPPQAVARCASRDDEVDAMYTSLFRELLTYMMEDPRNITTCTHLLFCAKSHRAHRRPRHQHRRDDLLSETGRHLGAEEQQRQPR
jgi:phosphate transport system protein